MALRHSVRPHGGAGRGFPDLRDRPASAEPDVEARRLALDHRSEMTKAELAEAITVRRGIDDGSGELLITAMENVSAVMAEKLTRSAPAPARPLIFT